MHGTMLLLCLDGKCSDGENCSKLSLKRNYRSMRRSVSANQQTNLNHPFIPVDLLSFLLMFLSAYNALYSALCPQKNKTRTFLAYQWFYLGLLKHYKIWRTYSQVYSGHKCSCICNEAYVIPLSETFYYNAVLQNWKPDHLIVVAAISQWRHRLSACVSAHGGHF